jgi:hypothetical protein
VIPPQTRMAMMAIHANHGMVLSCRSQVPARASVSGDHLMDWPAEPSSWQAWTTRSAMDVSARAPQTRGS